MSEFGALWDAPDAKRHRSPGTWDVYCKECGRFVDAVRSPVLPSSLRCRHCRQLRDVARPPSESEEDQHG